MSFEGLAQHLNIDHQFFFVDNDEQHEYWLGRHEDDHKKSYTIYGSHELTHAHGEELKS